MNYTNNHNLPESVFNILSKNRYTHGEGTDYSVTTLLQPPRLTQLKRRYDSELIEDVMDNVWSLFGSIAHSLLEEHGAENELAEERLQAKILDRIISGQVDSFHDGIITDYKVTSAWTLVYGSRLHEWTEQLNLYAYLFQIHNYAIRELRICCILRDWDKNKAKLDANYPQAPIQIIPIKLWTLVEQEAFIYEKVIDHKNAEDKSDYELPECTEKDMWASNPKWAVMKEGGKRAVKLYDTNTEAEDHVDNLTDAKYFVQKREGKRVRCENYCPVSSKCNQFLDYLRSQENI